MSTRFPYNSLKRRPATKMTSEIAGMPVLGRTVQSSFHPYIYICLIQYLLSILSLGNRRDRASYAIVAP